MSTAPGLKGALASAGPFAVRFWAHVDQSAGPDGCWPWTLGRSTRGYGCVRLAGKNRRAHRVALALTGVAIDELQSVIHSCDNPICCNPAHLAVGSHHDNMADAARKGRMPRGERSWTAKLTADDVRTVRRLYADGGHSHASLGLRFGLTAANIGRIVRREAWSHIT